MPTITDTSNIKWTYNLKTQGDVSTGTPNVYQVDYYFLSNVSELTGNGYDTSGGGTSQSMETIEAFTAVNSDQQDMLELAMGVSSGGTYSVFVTDVVSNVSFNTSGVTASTADINIGAVSVDWDADNNFTENDDRGTLGYIWEMYNLSGSAVFPSGIGYAYSQDIGQGTTYGTKAHADIWLNSSSAYGWSDTQVNLYPQRTIVHELLHALGLKHPIGTVLDNTQYTTMSEVHLLGMELGPSNDPDDFVLPTGLQIYDIAAIQEIFGKRDYSTRSSDTVYKEGQGFAGYDALTFDKNEPFIYTIWDGDGEDVIDASGYDDQVIIDLRQGSFSSIGKALDSTYSGVRGTGLVDENVGIAYYTVIENAIGTTQNDTIIGNAWDNNIYGGDGVSEDKLYGDGITKDSEAGFHEADTLDTRPGPEAAADDSGDDVLMGGRGHDTLFGGKGDDILHGGFDWDEIDSERPDWDEALQFIDFDDVSHEDDGTDWADYTGLSEAVELVADSMEPGYAVVDKGSSGTDVLISIERIRGTIYDDTYIGVEMLGNVHGGEGSDTYYSTWRNSDWSTYIFDTGGANDTAILDTSSSGANVVSIQHRSTQADVIAAVGTLVPGYATISLGGVDIEDSIEVIEWNGYQFHVAALEMDEFYDASSVAELYAEIFNGEHTRGLGDGATEITENYGYDTLTFASGISGIFDAQFSRNGDDLQIIYSGSDAVTINNFFLEGEQDRYEVEEAVFYDSSMSLGDIYLHALQQTGTGGDDVMTGLSSAYREYVNAFDGSAGNDTLTGGNGSDILNGGVGDDTMTGLEGNDVYTVNDAGDVVIEAANEGTDTVQASISYTLGSHLENLTLSGSSNLNGTGNSLDNVLTGNSGNNTLTGGTGNDTYVIGQGGTDTIVENASEGTDTVQSSVTWTLGANLENLTLTGSSNINGTGNNGNNVIQGNSGDNTLDGSGGTDTVSYANAAGGVTVNLLTGTATGDGTDTLTGIENVTGSSYTDVLTGDANDTVLYGLEGNDTLSGHNGADTMYGGLGDDIIYVTSTSDLAIEYADEGNDTVRWSGFTTPYTLPDHIENLIFAGTTQVTGTGNSLDNIITGNAIANTLSGLAGNDWLDGLGGNDVLIGGTGDDTYVVDSAGDTVTENAGEGSDTVRSSITYSIAALANVENIVLTGSSNINATGNGSANTLTGNSGNNTLSGGTGADSMAGAAGNDVYVVDNVGDVVTEGAGEGTDTVQASVTYTLSTDVENLTLTGSSNINATGNSGNNTLTGNTGNNTLEGGAGDDVLSGGSGSSDTASYANAPSGVTVNLLNGTATGGDGADTLSGIENVIGSAYADVLTGDANDTVLYGLGGNDTLSGHNGADTMYGGLGDDIIYVTSTSDLAIEYASEGNDTVRWSGFTSPYTLPDHVENLEFAGTAQVTGTGNSLDNVITGNDIANTLSGLGGNDTLVGAGGLDTLSGGSGNDTFVFDMATAFSNIDVITDFNISTQEDVLDLRDVLEDYDPLTDSLSDFLQIADSGGNSTVSVDRDGTGGVYSSVQIATLTGITGLTDEDALVASGNLIVS